MPDNNIQREIEDILNRLDEFVPEEGMASRMRRKTSSSGPLASVVRAIITPFTRISLRQVMLTALLLVVVGFVARGIPVGRWILVAGVILFLTAFALSFVSRGGSTTSEKQWRGRTIEFNQPSLADRLKVWFRSLRRRRS